MKNFKYFLLFILGFTFSLSVNAVEYEVVSPNTLLKIKLSINNGVQYEVSHNNVSLITPSKIALNLADGRIVGAGNVLSTSTNSVNGTVEPVFGKNKTIVEAYNELTISFVENYDLIVRAYDEGVAYRFVTRLGNEIVINSEDAIFNFPSTPTIFFPECDTHFYSEKDQKGIYWPIHQGYRNFERVYNVYNSPTAIANDKFSVTPVLHAIPGSSNYKVVITESDTQDYPGMYMEQNGYNSMRGKWANYPKQIMDPDALYSPNYWYSNHLVITRENYIAKTTGNRKFPWRVIIVSNDDKSLLNNELVYLLAEPSRIADTSWIKPGKSAWEWWHKAMLEGVDFPVGNSNLSFQLYKYYVDWASLHGIEYMTLDAGWSENYIKTLCFYASQKNVKIIVWSWASCVREYPNGDWIKRMKDNGVAGVKIDFFERNDQLAMRWGYEFAQRLAEHQMVALFHGCPVPTGLNRTYPNILNFEAVRGAEDNFWRSIVTPNYHTQFPFIRALAGPFDYTPGSMRNVTEAEFKPLDLPNTVPMSMGTRAHELSMFVIFDHWLGYLCDAPTEYDKYPDVRDFLAQVPAVWDKTVPLDAKLGEYILMAKQKEDKWYVGGMSNWSERDIQVDFSFLNSGDSYNAIILKDHANSNTNPKLYVNESTTVNSSSKLNIHCAKGGGFVIVLTKTGTGLNTVKESNLLNVTVDKKDKKLNLTSQKPIQSVWISTVLGQYLFNKQFKNEMTQTTISIDNLQTGTFILSAQIENTRHTKVFIN